MSKRANIIVVGLVVIGFTIVTISTVVSQMNTVTAYKKYLCAKKGA